MRMNVLGWADSGGCGLALVRQKGSVMWMCIGGCPPEVLSAFAFGRSRCGT